MLSADAADADAEFAMRRRFVRRAAGIILLLFLILTTAFTFQFFGDPNQKVILVGSSQLNPGAFDFTPLGLPGQLDIGTSMLGDLFIIFNGDDTQSIPNLFFETDLNGDLEASFTIPASVTGVTLPMQAFMRTTTPPFIALTNAIGLNIL